jgi:hypothetical protein
MYDLWSETEGKIATMLEMQTGLVLFPGMSKEELAHT